MNQEELNKKLELHKLYLEDDSQGEKADLHGANLHGANLHGADLRWADLRNAGLRKADLRKADLRNADLRKADIDFSGFSLQCTSLNMKLSLDQIYQFLHFIYEQQSDTKTFKLIKLAIYPFVKKWKGLKKHNLILEKPERLK